MWLFTNNTKHRHIIYRWKEFFTVIKNLRSLPQNKASFSSDQLENFHHFPWKSVSMIRSLLSWTEGTIMMRRLKGTYWDQEPLSKVAGDRCEEWGTHMPYLWRNADISSTTKLGTYCFGPFELTDQVCARIRRSEKLDHG